MKLSNTSIPYLIIVALVTMFAAVANAQTQQDWEERDATLVGRISHLEGTLTRYEANRGEWVPMVKDAPVVAGDQLYSDPDAKVELILPNNTWIRIDGDTEIQLIDLDERYTDLDLSLGTTRIYNKSTVAETKTTTPFGDVIIPAGSTADIAIYSDHIVIISLNDIIYFVHNRSERRHEVTDVGAALFANTDQVSASGTAVAEVWRNWNKKMDALWAMRAQTHGESVAYLPSVLNHDAYTLDTHGRWEQVYYQGAHYRFWRPVHVHTGWTPFSSGVWHVRWGDHVWISHEPFGYVTHHYGNWIFTANHWYWAPPVTRRMIRAGLPLFHIGLAWYPGRVAWIHAATHVGWFPLSPYEPYYSHHRWGRRAYVVTKNAHRHPPRHNYKHRRHAVVIHKAHLYHGKNYRNARIKNTARISAANRFQTAAVLNRSQVQKARSRPNFRHANPTPKVDKRRLTRTRENRPSPRVANEYLRKPNRATATKKVKRGWRTKEKRSVQTPYSHKSLESAQRKRIQKLKKRPAMPEIKHRIRPQTANKFKPNHRVTPRQPDAYRPKTKRYKNLQPRQPLPAQRPELRSTEDRVIQNRKISKQQPHQGHNVKRYTPNKRPSGRSPIPTKGGRSGSRNGR